MHFGKFLPFLALGILVLYQVGMLQAAPFRSCPPLLGGHTSAWLLMNQCPQEDTSLMPCPLGVGVATSLGETQQPGSLDAYSGDGAGRTQSLYRVCYFLSVHILLPSMRKKTSFWPYW